MLLAASIEHIRVGACSKHELMIYLFSKVPFTLFDRETKRNSYSIQERRLLKLDSHVRC